MDNNQSVRPQSLLTSVHSLAVVLVLIVLSVIFCIGWPVMAADGDEGGAAGQKQILFINSYGYDFETVPVVINEVSDRLKSDNTIHYLFMNEKYVDAATAEQKLSAELTDLLARTHYDIVILGDDAAFDFAIQHRDQYFRGIPLVYEDINSREKAEQYIDDPLIAGVVEEFPEKGTLDLARQLMPKARQVVVITDNSISGRGSAQQVLDEQSNFPDLTFSVFDCSTMTSEEIQQAIAAYTDDTILIYTVFNVDKSGRRYTLSQGVRMVTAAANIPVFKADEAGVGDGLLGGYVLSYESVGQTTAQLVRDILDGKQLSRDERCQRGSSRYLFDINVMKRFHINKGKLPKDAVYINDLPGFLELYGHILLPVFIVTILIINGILWYSRRQKAILLERLKRSGEAVRVEEAANRAKTAFLSRMSHDIRTPLNAIIGMNFLARKEIHQPEVAKIYLDKIDVSSKVLMTLINDILDVSQIESGKLELNLAPYEITQLYINLREVFTLACEKGHIRFRMHYPDHDVQVMADAARISQIFGNILSNAVKFTPPGGIITFDAQSRQTGDSLYCTVTVTDTGCGIPSEFQKKMFEPFTQADNEPINKIQGAGIGLMIVKNLIKQMNGTIAIESKAGQGTKIVVSLPFTICTTPAVPDNMPMKLEDVTPALQGKRILVVEDNQLNAEIEQGILEEVDVQVELAENGLVALKKVKDASDGYYDAIIMDIRMPVMDGMEATRAIRNLERPWCQQVPIIAVTADAFDADVRRFLDCGMNACLTKPVELKKLYGTLMHYTNK